jgi:hypoxanthine phosphoribosyltransferase
MPRREVLTWVDVNSLIDHLLTQIDKAYDVLLLINPTGLVPGGMLANAIKIPQVFTARVELPSIEAEQLKDRRSLLAMPKFSDLPPASKLKGQRTLIVDANWGCGRLLTSVRMHVEAYDGKAHTAVLHFCPNKNVLETVMPDYFAATTDAEIIYPWEVGFGDQTKLFPKMR